MMSIKQKLTGKPSIDRPWMQYYPQEMIENLTVPNSTIYEYLMYNCPGDDVVPFTITDVTSHGNR